MPTSAQLERKAERARERLSDRIADLRYHVSPTTVVSDLLGGVNPRAWGDDVLPLLAKQARNNPIRDVQQLAPFVHIESKKQWIGPSQAAKKELEHQRIAQFVIVALRPGTVNREADRQLARDM